MGYSNFELTFPIIDRVRGATFFDGGFNNDGVFDYSMDDVHASAGFGLRLNLPIGPLRLDIGFPIVHNSRNDDAFNFHFDVGYQF
jgi:outer membrane protein insertion porin family